MTEQQIPPGPKNLICPFRGKSMDKVCSSCPLWYRVETQEKPGAPTRDRWDCSLAWLPTLMIQTAKHAQSGAIATESFRNEMIALSQGRPQPPRLANGQAPLTIEGRRQE